jgi:hypothetical protein
MAADGVTEAANDHYEHSICNTTQKNLWIIVAKPKPCGVTVPSEAFGSGVGYETLFSKSHCTSNPKSIPVTRWVREFQVTFVDGRSIYGRSRWGSGENRRDRFLQDWSAEREI